MILFLRRHFKHRNMKTVMNSLFESTDLTHRQTDSLDRVFIFRRYECCEVVSQFLPFLHWLLDQLAKGSRGKHRKSLLWRWESKVQNPSNLNRLLTHGLIPTCVSVVIGLTLSLVVHFLLPCWHFVLSVVTLLYTWYYGSNWMGGLLASEPWQQWSM